MFGLCLWYNGLETKTPPTQDSQGVKNMAQIGLFDEPAHQIQVALTTILNFSFCWSGDEITNQVITNIPNPN